MEDSDEPESLKTTELIRLLNRHDRGVKTRLAKHLNLSRDHIYRITNGKRKISTEQLLIIGDFLSHDFRPFLKKHDIAFVDEGKKETGPHKGCIELQKKYNKLLESNNRLIKLVAEHTPELLAKL